LFSTGFYLSVFLILVGYETICINNCVEQLSVKTGKKAKDKVLYFAVLYKHCIGNRN